MIGVLATIGSLCIHPAAAWTRYIGDPSDPIMSSISARCNGTDQNSFKTGRCPVLLRCFLDALPSDLTAGMQSGGNIASLVPTILALIGAPPLDLVQLAILSPHRALATCCFSIGLPSSLFRQLNPLSHSLSEKIDELPKVRGWDFQVPRSRQGQKSTSWRRVLVAVGVDVIILGLASVMIWFNWKVNTQIMITWRCEYGWLLFAWPLACIGWLFLAMGLLWAMAAGIDVIYWISQDAAPVELSVWQLIKLPYKADGEQYLKRVGREVPPSRRRRIVDKIARDSALEENIAASLAPLSIALNAREIKPPRTVTVSITMPHEHHILSWRWYEAALETLAVGIYLYGTFVLTSTVGLSGETGILFATVMTLCLSAVRLMGSVF